MGGAIGPVLSTGVALVCAAVIVANPIAVPPKDVQISVAEMSAGLGNRTEVSDPAFWKALAAAAPESANPLSVLQQVLGSLAEHASARIGKQAVAEAWAAGAAAEPTPAPTMTGAGAPDSRVNVSEPTVSPTPGVPTPVVGGVDFQQTLTNLASNAQYLGGKIVEAASAAENVIIAVPRLILDALTYAADGDIPAALNSVALAAKALLSPPLIILAAIQTVIKNGVAGLPAVDPAAGTQVGGARSPAALVAEPGGDQQMSTALTPTPAEVTSTSDHQREPTAPVGAHGATGGAPGGLEGTPGSASVTANPRQVAPGSGLSNGAADLTTGNKFVPRTTMNTSSPVRNAMKQFGDTILKVTGSGGAAGPGTLDSGTGGTGVGIAGPGTLGSGTGAGS